MNSQYNLPSDQSSRNPISMSQPVLTRSLPSVAVSVPMTLDNVIVSGIHQSYVASPANMMGTQSRAPITAIGGIGDGNINQKQALIPNCFQNPQPFQKFSPPVMSTARPIAAPQQPVNYSSVIPSAKILDKSKKKGKSRMKTKYLLKIIKIDESVNAGETVLTFEMMSPKSQMRFTCCLNKGINNLEVLNSDGEYGQIPGELGKKDIIESLVNTVKKMCQQLTDDINSIPLNDEYIFHPCGPNIGLLKLSDYLMMDPDSNATVNSIQTLQPSATFSGSCASSRSLSRHPSSEDLSGPISGGQPMSYVEQLSTTVMDYEASKSMQPNVQELQKKISKVAFDNDSNLHTIVSTKCLCPIGDSVFKVPEYMFPYVKQIVDKLLNHSCKGLIILPQSNDILTRNVRILEIPADHMFIGMPCADSSYNVIKAQKDKDFIIAKDNRYPDRSSEKCVYQKPSDSVILLDSSGEIQHIEMPTLVIPPKPGYENQKTTVKELPSELTHSKDQSLDCDQIVSVLQSLTHIQNTSDQSQDELFDSPVMLEPVKSLLPKTQANLPEKPDNVEYYGRRGSDESIVSQSQQPSQIQVEKIYCEYVALHKASCHDDGSLSVVDNSDRDLPKQQVRSRKISNESLDSISAIRNRATSMVTCVNEADLLLAQKVLSNSQINVQKSMSTSVAPFINELDVMPPQQCLQKVMGNQPINYQSTQKSLAASTGPFVSDCDHLQKMLATNQLSLQNSQIPITAIRNPIPLQRMSNVTGPTAGQFVLANPNPTAGMGGNIFLQNVPNVPMYNAPSQGSVTAGVLSQSNSSNPAAVGNLNYPHMHPGQVVHPSCMTQIHQIQQNPGQRLPGSSSNVSSSQLLSSMQTMPQNLIPTPVYPVQMPSFSDQHSLQSSQMAHIRQMPPQSGSSQYLDQNMINSIMAENMRIQLMNQPLGNAQPQAPSPAQPTPVLILPHPPPLAQIVTTHAPTGTNIKLSVPESMAPQVDTPHPSVATTDIESKPKSEQVVGRFVIRPVTDSAENS